MIIKDFGEAQHPLYGGMIRNKHRFKIPCALHFYPQYNFIKRQIIKMK